MSAVVRSNALKVAIAALLAVVLGCLPSRARAARDSDVEREPFAAQGIRVGLLIPRISVDGDFNGESAHVRSTEVLQVPKIDPAFGVGLSVGGRGGRYSVEVNWQYTKHDATLPTGASTEATLISYNVDFKYYFRADKPLQPFLLVGFVPFARLIVANASAGISGGIASADYRSEMAGFNVGLGLEWFATKRISIGGSAFYRRIMFEDGKGISNELSPVKYAGHGYNAVAAVSYCYGDF